MSIQLIVVGVVVNSDGKVLLVKEKENKWALPGGLVKPGERLDEALMREINEEAGMLVSIDRISKLYQMINSNNTDLIVVFLCKYVKEVSKGELEAKWVPPFNIYNLDLLYPETPLVVESVLKGKEIKGVIEIGGRRYYFYF